MEIKRIFKLLQWSYSNAFYATGACKEIGTLSGPDMIHHNCFECIFNTTEKWNVCHVMSMGQRKTTSTRQDSNLTSEIWSGYSKHWDMVCQAIYYM